MVGTSIIDISMNKWLYFGAGVITGVLLVFVVMLFINKNAQQDAGLNYYDQPGEIVKEHSFTVMQVMADNAALVMPRSSNSFTVYLLVTSEKRLFYDDETVNVPEGNVARIIGTYRYPTRDGMEKTVPIIKILKE